MAELSAAIRQAQGPDGTRIVYRVDGAAAARPLVLLHGWAQSSACWGPRVIGPLARRYRVIAVDLRGHGVSDAPAAGYDDPASWAGDVAAVLAAEGIGPGAGAVLAGWSYGGLVLCDYLAAHPEALADGTVGAVALVGALTGIGRGRAGGRVGTAMRAALPDVLSEDPAVAVPAIISLTSAFRATGDGAHEQALLGAALATAPRVRAALFARETGYDGLLAALPVPALVLHGTADTVVDPSAAEHAAGLIPRARASYWEAGGHAPFAEDPARFVAEFDGFAAELPEPAAGGAR